MAGYGVAERVERAHKPRTNMCGSCGCEVSRGRLICQSCKDDVFFTAVCVQVENEKSESGESQ